MHILAETTEPGYISWKSKQTTARLNSATLVSTSLVLFWSGFFSRVHKERKAALDVHSAFPQLGLEANKVL